MKRNMLKRRIFEVTISFFLILSFLVAFIPSTLIRAQSNGVPILKDENGHVYIEDPDYPGKKCILYCMNNKLNWPWWNESMGSATIPDYTEGYLQPDDFQSQEDYEECMRRLSIILYAGYPYNGERLYQIVDSTELHVPTEEEFNEMLIPMPVLKAAFPYLEQRSFTYQDFVKKNENMDILLTFMQDVTEMKLSGGKTSNGLTYEDIAFFPFYKAADCMINTDAPLENYALKYPNSTFVIEEQAYNATQFAVWRLLNYYNIPDNNITEKDLIDCPLGEVLYNYSERGDMLNYKPDLEQLEFKGDLTFGYNPKDDMWHSRKLKIIEPADFKGKYKLVLPEGITAICANRTYVYGNEEYELVSDHQPQEGEYYGIEADFVWLKEFKQYSPNPDIEVNGKKFQHMGGAIIENERIAAQFSFAAEDIGSLEVSKKVIGDDNSTKEFNFEISFPDHKITGLYGELEFNQGVARFELKKDETILATNLPAGAAYVVKEVDVDDYQKASVNSVGHIAANQITKVVFTNTALPDLTISKLVKGEMGDKTKLFTFEIMICKEDGVLLTGDFQYEGAVIKGYENECESPQNGTLTFQNGKAEITLSHGQQVILKNLPLNSISSVIEKEANTDGYQTTYNNEASDWTGTLDKDTEIQVVNIQEVVPDTGVINQFSGDCFAMIIGISAILIILCSLIRKYKGKMQ